MTTVRPPVVSEEEQDAYADPLRRYKREGEWTAGVRPVSVVETLDDVEWALDPAHREAKQPQLVCGFCGDTRRARTYDEAARWFRTHPCDGEGVPIEQWLAA